MAFDCTAVGDTIAYAIAPILTCESRAGINLTTSKIINVAYGNGVFHKYCIISGGTYDSGTKTFGNLIQIRRLLSCKYYTWILPTNAVKAKLVVNVAHMYKDVTISFTPGVGGLPSNYKTLAGQIHNVTDGLK